MFNINLPKVQGHKISCKILKEKNVCSTSQDLIGQIYGEVDSANDEAEVIPASFFIY